VVEVGQFTGGATSGLDTRVLLFNENGLATTIISNFTAGQTIYTTNSSTSVAAVSTGNIDLTATATGLKITWDTTVYDLNDFGGALPSEEVVDSGVIRAEARNEGNTQLIFQIGSNEGHNMIAGIDDMSAKALGITDDSLDVTNQNVAERTIMVIDGAIHKVSSQRALLGAVQNRLEHTISNLGVAEENLTAAESRIRDADMAKEMMQFTKQQILLQSANAMLAQANALPQNVLQLLR
jgi:flagellin